jgi:signal transduction histidine kinase
MTFFRSIRVRLAALILIAMVGLIGMLIYQQVQKHNSDRDHGDENLQRLAVFVAHAERERFQAAERLLTLAKQAQSLRTMALNPTSRDAFDKCTSGLFVLDQLLPGTSGFSLWDTNGNSLCSSKGAKVGEFHAADHLWFTNAVARGDVATGDYEEAPPDNLPNVAFGAPIFDANNQIVAYLSTGLKVDDADNLLAGANLPDTGRVFIVDQNGVIINSTIGMSGTQTEGFNDRFGNDLHTFLDAKIGDAANGRRAAAVRVTDANDTAVSVVVSADPSSLATPLTEALWRNLWPVALVTLLILGALWFLGQRWITRPVLALVRANDAIAGGALETRVRDRSGISEWEHLAASFNEMAANRERATHAKDEFLGLVSHELKTPITTVLGNAEVLRRRGDRLDAATRQDALEDIHDSAQRLAAIIDNLLALARLERGTGLESEPLSLLRMAESSAQEEMRRAAGRQIRVTGDPDVLVLAGEMYVDQVLQNLIANAIKYSPDGEAVDVIVEHESGSGVVRVLDRGRGIDAAERNAVFEPFYRSASTATAAEGMGIGLSVCKRLIEALDGTIWFKEREGGGAEFGFGLPLIEDDGIAPEPAPDFGDDVAATTEPLTAPTA